MKTKTVSKNSSDKGGPSAATCSPSLAEKIASALLTPRNGQEGTRLAIKLRQDDGTEKDLGGNCKQSIIIVINRLLAEHEANAQAEPRGREET